MTMESHSEVLPTVLDPKGSVSPLLLLMKSKNENIDVDGGKCTQMRWPDGWTGKVPVFKSGDLSLIPRTHMVGGQNQFLPVVL